MRKSKSLRLGGSVAMIRLLLKAIMPLTLLASPMLAQAARVAPMIVELEPVGRQSVARIELTNDNDRDIPYEVRMVLGEISETGELMMTAADDQFLVFPTQAIVESRSQQVFRIHQRKEACFDAIKTGVQDFFELFDLMYNGNRMNIPAFPMLIGYLDLLIEEGRIIGKMGEEKMGYYLV